jgi:hypothetical protein
LVFFGVNLKERARESQKIERKERTIKQQSSTRLSSRRMDFKKGRAEERKTANKKCPAFVVVVLLDFRKNVLNQQAALAFLKLFFYFYFFH